MLRAPSLRNDDRRRTHAEHRHPRPAGSAQTGPRHLADARRGMRPCRAERPGAGLPAYRHGRRLRQRGGRGPGAGTVAGAPRSGAPDHQGLVGPVAAGGHARLTGAQPGRPAHRPRRPVHDPLAGQGLGPAAQHRNPGRPARGRQGPAYRRGQLSAGAAAPNGRGTGRAALRHPGGVSRPARPAAAARLRPPARHGADRLQPAGPQPHCGSGGNPQDRRQAPGPACANRPEMAARPARGRGHSQWQAASPTSASTSARSR